MASRSGPSFTESEEQQKVRFQVELEFVQCLANPNYLNYLAQRGIFKDQAFINYLKYLLYWKQPEYAKYLKYPQGLHMLELLQYEQFRRELMNTNCARFIDDQQLLHWQHYQRKRCKLLQDQADKMSSSAAASASSTAAVPSTQAQTTAAAAAGFDSRFTAASNSPATTAATSSGLSGVKRELSGL